MHVFSQSRRLVRSNFIIFSGVPLWITGRKVRGVITVAVPNAHCPDSNASLSINKQISACGGDFIYGRRGGEEMSGLKSAESLLELLLPLPLPYPSLCHSKWVMILSRHPAECRNDMNPDRFIYTNSSPRSAWLGFQSGATEDNSTHKSVTLTIRPRHVIKCYQLLSSIL